MDAQSRFLGLHRIDTREQLEALQAQLETQMKELDSSRRQLRYQCRTEQEPQKQEAFQIQIAQLGENRKELRKDAMLCKQVSQRSADLQEKYEMLQAEQKAEQAADEFRKEELKHEQHRRSGGSGREDVP